MSNHSQQNNSVTIGNMTIHQSANGLYLLTDLWKASGEKRADEPNRWLKLESTKKHIEYFGTKTGNINLSDYYETVQGRGKIQGTYVCKKLVYSYAMWISPEFNDLVIDTFDALMNAQTNEAVIAIKNELNNVQIDMYHREPRDKQSLAVILQIATAKVKPYFDYLVEIGEVGRRWIPQHDRAEYYATDKSKHVIGKKGNTLLFDDDIRFAFPEQHNLVD